MTSARALTLWGVVGGLVAGAAAWAVPASPAVLAPPPVRVPQPLPPVPACLFQVDPVPDLSQLDRPSIGFPELDHFFLTSSTHLQGKAAPQKWVGGLLYMPPSATGFDGFTSAVIVDNPDELLPADIEIDYFTHTGVLISTTAATILPRGHYVEAASPIGLTGVGSALVRVVSGPDIVGAALHQSDTFFGTTDPDEIGGGVIAGLSSMEQLQKDLGKTDLWWGPLPVTAATAWDFVNGEVPFYWIVNPNGSTNSVQIDVTIYNQATGTVVGTVPWRTVDIPAFGTLWDVSGTHLSDLGTSASGFFNAVAALYTPAPPDWDLVIHAYSLDGLSILGDGVMTDFYADGPLGVPLNEETQRIDQIPPQILYGKFRMASTMLATTPRFRLVNPDLSYEAGPTGVIQTLMGVANVGTTNAGPLRVEYFDRDGARVGTGNYASLPPDASLRIGPGSPGYPTGDDFFGWARITACRPGADLVGWSVREINETGFPHFHKAFGETLKGTNGGEPGNGIPTPAGDTRKISPYVRVTFGNWPGYTTFVNNSVPNIDDYSFSLFAPDDLGTGGPTAFPCGSAAFDGIPWAYTSTTYEDPINTCFPEPNMSLHIDHLLGTIEGIDVLGDPFEEYGIPGFAGAPEP